MHRLSALLFALAFSASASAEFVGPGTTPNLTTVQAVAAAGDDLPVVLEGYLVRELRPEHYVFKDATGEIEVEIDQEDFGGIAITPEIKVRIRGEVDRNFGSTTIDVDHIQPVQ